MLRAFDRRRPISAVVLALLLAGSARAEGANLYDPALRFRTIRTEHFFIHFHQGENRLAARLADIAEDVWPTVGQALGFPAPKTTHVVLADQSEMANGWATPVPYNTIFVTAAAPPGSDFIGRNDDWLRLVFTHEFTHIVHLSRSEGWARVFRGIFGRTPIAFPNLWLPKWQVEGLAAWEESAITGEGRLFASDFRAIEREAARQRRLEPLDRVNGGLTDWPGGIAPYAFGLGFHDYLANRFGEARLGQLARRTSRSVPFFASRAFKSVYGESLGTLWRDYQQSLSNAENASNRSNSSNPSNLSNPVTRLTTDGYSVLGPRFAPRDCPGCPPEIVYTVQNPDGFPTLKMTTVAGSPSQRLADRFLGSTVAVSRNLLVFDQQELHRNTSLYSDLYVLDRRTEDVRRLTNGQRLQDPDFSPDGQSIVCVRQKSGVGEIVLVRLPQVALKPDTTYDTTYVTLISEADTQFSAPRWSPDGRSIAVEQHRLGHRSEIAVVDVPTGIRRVVAADADARIVTPAWRPDGRALVAAADFDGDTFNLYEFGLADQPSPPRRLTRVSGSATWPDISPDGRTIVFVGYTVEGFDLFLTPYPDSSTAQTTGVPARPSTPADRENDDVPTPRDGRYSPWSTLRPTSWTPIVEGDSDSDVWAGIETAGFDVLGRHAYAASAAWLVAAPEDALTPSTSSPDWNVSYAYDRWRPTIFASASRTTTFFAGPADADGRPEPATLRETGVEVGVLFPIRHIRANYRALTSIIRKSDRITLTDDVVAIRHSAWRAGAAVNTARLYGYSISREDGATIGATAETAWRESGPEHANAFTVDGRAYLSGLPRHHVVALRASGGRASGDTIFSRTFLLGGPGPNADVLDFGREAFSLLRGFQPRAFAGTHIALVNAEYRFPLARPQRGVGTWPFFLHTIHGALFTDVGNAWVDRFRAQDAKSSIGAELSLDLFAGYSFPFTTTFGGAWGRDGADRREGGVFYFRIGRAF